MVDWQYNINERGSLLCKNNFFLAYHVEESIENQERICKNFFLAYHKNGFVKTTFFLLTT